PWRGRTASVRSRTAARASNARNRTNARSGARTWFPAPTTIPSGPPPPTPVVAVVAVAARAASAASGGGADRRLAGHEDGRDLPRSGRHLITSPTRDRLLGLPAERGGTACRCSSMVELLLPKQTARVRFPSSAPPR